jgi:streptogramin lyase
VPDLLKIDPASGRVRTYMIPGYRPLTQLYGIAPVEGLGSLWMRIGDGIVVQVAPTNGKVLATYPADPAGGGGDVAVAYGSLWVANFGTDTVWRVQIQK